MIEFIKKNWDIISGIISGLLLAAMADFELDTVQLYYSIIILMLVTIGVFRMFKQAIEKRKDERKHNIVDSMLDGQKSIKAISLAQAPTREGEKIGKSIIILFRGIKPMLEKIKTFLNKYKGYMLTIALAILSGIEMCGGYINAAFGGVLTVNGIAVLPIVTLALTAFVGIVSNGFTTEQMEKIKALFSKSNTNELVLAEIKKTIKEKTAQLAQFNKVLTTQENELSNYESERETLNNALQAKKEMFAMIPQLATDEDVKLAANAVYECNAKITEKKNEIAETKATIANLTTMINALKNQL